MATYIILGTFTDQGIKNVKETVNRSDAVKEMAKKFGATMKEIYWTLGAHDIVAIVDAPDDASVAAFGLAIAAQGNVRAQTLRAMSRDDMGRVLGKLS